MGAASRIEPQTSKTVPCDPAGVRTARRFVRATLHGQPDELVERVELLVSEVVTNAIVHARSSCHVSITVQATRTVHVEVHDHGGGLVAPRVPEADELRGRGLMIVDALADAWGSTPLADGGNCVWFELTAPFAERARRS